MIGTMLSPSSRKNSSLVRMPSRIHPRTVMPPTPSTILLRSADCLRPATTAMVSAGSSPRRRRTRSSADSSRGIEQDELPAVTQVPGPATAQQSGQLSRRQLVDVQHGDVRGLPTAQSVRVRRADRPKRNAVYVVDVNVNPSGLTGSRRVAQRPLRVADELSTGPNLSAPAPSSLVPTPLILGPTSTAASLRWIRV